MLLALGAIGAWWLWSRPTGLDGAPAEASPEASVTAPPTGAPAAPPLAGEPPDVAARAPEPRPEPEPEEMTRLYVDALRRFEESLVTSGATEGQVDEAVLSTFETLDAFPVLMDGGYMDGVRIRAMPDGHPFARAGFRVGDRLMSVDGLLLQDPSELPGLFVRLERSFEVCVERAGEVLCADVTARILESSG